MFLQGTDIFSVEEADVYVVPCNSDPKKYTQYQISLFSQVDDVEDLFSRSFTNKEFKLGDRLSISTHTASKTFLFIVTETSNELNSIRDEDKSILLCNSLIEGINEEASPDKVLTFSIPNLGYMSNKRTAYFSKHFVLNKFKGPITNQKLIINF